MTVLAVIEEQGLLYVVTSTARALLVAIAVLLPLALGGRLFYKGYRHLRYKEPAPRLLSYGLVFVFICLPVAWMAYVALNADAAYRDVGQHRQPSSAKPPPDTDAEWREYESETIEEVNSELQRAGDERRDQLINAP